MRLLLVLTCLLTAFTPTLVPKSQFMTSTPDITSSPDLQPLKNDIHRYENDLQKSRIRQDRWNSWYLGLGVAALAIATAFGIASWACQKKASAIEVASRPITDKLAEANAQLRESIDHAAQVEVAKAQTDASNASARAGSAERGAGEANERAAKAQSSLAVAEQHSAEANAKAEGFRADIAKANASAAQAEAQVADAHRAAAEANRIAESERLARLQLEARLADRVITAEQQMRLTQAFVSIKGETIDVVTVGDTPEINNTMNAIINSISAAGVFLNAFHPFGNTPARGVVIGARKDASTADKKACESLVLILRETLDGGVSQSDFDGLDASKFAGSSGSTLGAKPMWQSPIRLLIASK